DLSVDVGLHHGGVENLECDMRPAIHAELAFVQGELDVPIPNGADLVTLAHRIADLQSHPGVASGAFDLDGALSAENEGRKDNFGPGGSCIDRDLRRSCPSIRWQRPLGRWKRCRGRTLTFRTTPSADQRHKKDD